MRADLTFEMPPGRIASSTSSFGASRTASQDGEALAQPHVGDVAVAVVGRLREDGEDQLVERLRGAAARPACRRPRAGGRGSRRTRARGPCADGHRRAAYRQVGLSPHQSRCSIRYSCAEVGPMTLLGSRAATDCPATADLDTRKSGTTPAPRHQGSAGGPATHRDRLGTPSAPPGAGGSVMPHAPRRARALHAHIAARLSFAAAAPAAQAGGPRIDRWRARVDPRDQPRTRLATASAALRGQPPPGPRRRRALAQMLRGGLLRPRRVLRSACAATCASAASARRSR